MYTGRLIDELIATVERAEQLAQHRADLVEMEHWFAFTPKDLGAAQQNLLGVA